MPGSLPELESVSSPNLRALSIVCRDKFQIKENILEDIARMLSYRLDLIGHLTENKRRWLVIAGENAWHYATHNVNNDSQLMPMVPYESSGIPTLYYLIARGNVKSQYQIW